MNAPLILQFGTSRFLQAHVDLFAHQAAEAGQRVPGIVIVQTTRDPARAKRLRGFADPAGFPVVLRGIADGAPIDRMITVRSVIRGLNAHNDWPALADLFVNQVSHVVSNTGDTGYDVPAEDRAPSILDGSAPRSFPAILLALLHRRWCAGADGVTILPCELVQRNGIVLRDLIRGLARQVGAEADFDAWLAERCVWANTLVDRIVSEPIDPVGAIAEPYALWAIETQPGLAMPFEHPDVTLTPNLEPFERLKLHILNLGHSWLAERWAQDGADGQVTVRAMLADPSTSLALQSLYADEVVPGFAARELGDEATQYVARTLERFSNPFLDHLLADIHADHAAKLAKRVGGFLTWTQNKTVTMPRLHALAASGADA